MFATSTRPKFSQRSDDGFYVSSATLLGRANSITVIQDPVWDVLPKSREVASRDGQRPDPVDVAKSYIL